MPCHIMCVRGHNINGQSTVPPLLSSFTESRTLLSDPFVKQTRWTKICSMQLKIRPCLHAACILSILIFWELTIKRLKSSFFWHKNFGPQNILHMAKILGNCNRWKFCELFIIYQHLKSIFTIWKKVFKSIKTSVWILQFYVWPGTIMS